MSSRMSIFALCFALVACVEAPPRTERSHSGSAEQTAPQGSSRSNDSLSPTLPGQGPNTPQPLVTDQDGCINATADICKAEALVVQYTNDLRRKFFGKPLLQDYKVSVVSRRWSELQAQAGAIGHDGFPSERFAEYQRLFNTSPSGSSMNAENVAMNHGSTPEEVARNFVRAWTWSPGHFFNMTGRHKRIGVGIVRSASGAYYATQIFGD